MSQTNFLSSTILTENTFSVYQVWNKNHTSPAGLYKIFKNKFPSDFELRRIQREYDYLKKFDHPSIIKAISQDNINGNNCIRLEYFEGEALNPLILSQKKIEVKVNISIKILEGLDEIHQKNYIYKALHPNAILISPDYRKVKLLNFYHLKKISRDAQFASAQEALDIGLAYSSPEQTGRMNRSIDTRSDLYSLGVILYELFTGVYPYPYADMVELAYNIIAKNVKSPAEVNPELPTSISKIIEKLLNKNADERYQSCQGLIFDLKKFLSNYKNSGLSFDFNLGSNDISQQFQIPVNLYGREKELLHLKTIKELDKNQKKRITLISGYSGVGKSSLIKEFEKIVGIEKGFFISGKFDQLGQNAPLSPVFEALRELIEELLTKSNQEINYWKTKVLSAVGNSGQLMINNIPVLELLIGKQEVIPDLPAVESKNRFNEIFSRFIKAFCDEKNPLFIFLDDLQWMDSTTRSWIENEIFGQQMNHLYLLGAYRNNEVNSDHPLMLMLERLKSNSVSVDTLTLQPFDLEVTQKFICDTLHVADDKTKALGQLLYEKTRGNPYFLKQILLSLYDKEAIYFDGNLPGWNFKIEEVYKAKISDNVIDLISELIEKLPNDHQDILRAAACIGNTFSIPSLAYLTNLREEELREKLLEVSHLGIISPYREWDLALNENYFFQHDKIQQSALLDLDPKKKKSLQSRLGWSLYEEIPNLENNNHIFSIADNLNAVYHDLNDQELTKLVDINYHASIRASRTNAYSASEIYIQYINEIQPLLETKINLEQQIKILTQEADTAHMLGKDDYAEIIFDKALNLAKDPLRYSDVAIGKIRYYNNILRFNEAYTTGRGALAKLGVNIPPKFIPPLLLKEFLQFKILRRNKPIMDIIELPEMEDERIKKAMLVMSSCARSAYQIKPELCVSVSAKMVNLTLQKGLAYGGSVGFLAFGPIFHGAILNNKTSGFEFGKLTLSILDKFKNKTNKAEINFVVGYFAIPWKQPATVMENYYQIAYESGIETGDLFHASCACCGMIQSYWMRGVEFNKIISIAAKYLKFLDRIKNTEAILTIESVLKTIENLQGKSKSKTSYDSIEFSEEKYIENIKTFASRHFAHYYYINKMASLYLWGEYEEGLKVSIQAENYLKDSPGMLHTAEHFFYQGLLIAAANPEKLSYKYNRLLKRIISKFKKYAADCPENFEDKYLLLQAEWAGIKKDTFVKSKLLNDAQKSAAEYKHIQIQAIASMRLADLYYKSDSKKICKIHLDEALYFLNQWGAKGVAESVAKEYFEKAGFLDLAKFSSDSLNKDQISSSLDLITIVKSTEAISSQVRFKDLIEAMISIVTENAGAERVVFILSQNDNLTIRSDNFNPDLINDSISTSYEDYYNVPHSVINYTLNTKNPVMINNAHEDEVYRHDPYITDNKLKSILCLPFLKQGKISAILYLENNLTTGAFTKERIDLLKLLSGQIAISIDNALLYDNLEEKVEFRTQELRKEKEKSENLLLNILPAEIAEELKETGTTEAKSFEQVTVLFTDIKNFSSICEHLSAEELVKEIHYFYSEFDKIIGNYNIEKIKTIGDCYMCAGGLTKSSDSAPLETVQAAMEMNQFLLKEIEKQSTSSRTSELLNMRIGLHTGPVVAGIVGIKKFAYDIWGDTVNIASRMESNGEPGKINISGNTYEYIKNNYQCTYRGKIEIKNRGLIDMYFVDREV